MKKELFLMMIACLCLGSMSYAQHRLEIDTLLNQKDPTGTKFGYWEERQGTNVYTGLYKDNQREGQWVKLSSSKLVLAIDNYKHGKLEAHIIKFNNRGNIVSRTEYRNGLQHGAMYEYGATGNNIMRVANYRFGLLDGHSQIYYDNGRLQEDSYFKKGLRHGTSKWYDENAKLVAEFNYKNGLFSGSQKSFYPDGQVKTEEIALQGLPVGERKEYFSTGKLKLKGQYKNGARDGIWFKYSQDGASAPELIYKNGKLKKK